MTFTSKGFFIHPRESRGKYILKLDSKTEHTWYSEDGIEPAYFASRSEAKKILPSLIGYTIKMII